MKATAVAGSNIALVKYWGQLDPALNLPANSSISMTLDNARTTTTVEWSEAFETDTLEIGGAPAGERALARARLHLDRIRQLAGSRLCARVVSHNTFPAESGVASSAAGFAALTVAATHALGLRLEQDDLSRLARLASGSACRSLFGGYVEWIAGARHEDSYAVPFLPANHWRLVDIIAVVSRSPKEVSSEAGHRLAPGSPFFGARLAGLHATLARVRSALLARDFEALGENVEAEALSMHAVMITSRPLLWYFAPATIAVMQALPRWRAEGIPAYFTLDAGPNVHVLTLPEYEQQVSARLRAVPGVEELLVCYPGPAAELQSLT